MSGPISWGADCDVSMPEPRDASEDVTVLGGGYVFTQYGLRHDFTKTDAEVHYLPPYAPLPSAEGAKN